MSDLSSSIDLNRVLLAQIGLSLLAALSHSPTYNLPLLLYGLTSLSPSSQSTDPSAVRTFLSLLTASFALDIVWFYAWAGERISWFAWWAVVVVFLLKPVGLLAGLGNLRQRGEAVVGGDLLPGSGGGPGARPSLSSFAEPHPDDLSPPLPVWSMPGFSSFSNDPPTAPPPGPSPHSHQCQSSHLTQPSSPPPPPPSSHPRPTRSSTATTATTTYQAGFDADAQDVGEVGFDRVRGGGGAAADLVGGGTGEAAGRKGAHKGSIEGYHSIE